MFMGKSTADEPRFARWRRCACFVCVL